MKSHNPALTQNSSRAGTTPEPLLILAVYIIGCVLLVPYVGAGAPWPLPFILVVGLGVVYLLRLFWQPAAPTRLGLPGSVWIYLLLSGITGLLLYFHPLAVLLFTVLPILAFRIELLFLKKPEEEKEEP